MYTDLHHDRYSDTPIGRKIKYVSSTRMDGVDTLDGQRGKESSEKEEMIPAGHIQFAHSRQ